MTRRRLLVGAAALLVACGTKKKPPSPDDPPLVVRDDSVGLRLTWIDEKGDFFVVMHPKDVPLAFRDVVRVVDENKEDGTHDTRIFLADLRTPRPDGAYPVKASTKAEFDQIAALRRQKRGPTLEGAADAGAPQPQAPADVPQQADTLAPVVIYGAPWCGPCHEAAAYLRKKGVRYVEKDVDSDATAAAEMKQKLRHAGMPSGSIPVIDVRGKVLVGFNPRAIDEALGRAT